MVDMKKPPAYSRPTYAIDFIPCDTHESVFLGSPAFDRAIRLNIVLGSEAWIAKRQLKIVESLVAKNIMPTAARIESYAPTAAEDKAWAAERDQFIKSNFGPLIADSEISPPFNNKLT